MPDPNNPVAPHSEPAPEGVNTAEWVAAPGASVAPVTITANPFDNSSSQIHTQRLSTPGPGEFDRNTATGDTENMAPDTSNNSGVPSIPGYRIEKLIGRGGMGKVYKAVHLELGRVEALKLITLAGRDESYVRERFDREVRALAAIDHPNVVPVYHAGEWLGFPFLTMKYIPGGPLSQHLKRFTGKPELSAQLMVKVARAVQSLHEAGILHRDLKPLNVLLGENDEPLVADFGLARWLDDPTSDVTFTHVPIGTRPYMSPEQTLGQRAIYGVPCDVWAIGVTLYELLAGQRPFADSQDGTSDLFELIRSAEVPPFPDGFPAELLAIARKCMAKKPEDRYRSASAIADDLERWLKGEKVEASLTAISPRGRQPFGQKRRAKAAIAGLVLAFAAAAFSFWMPNSAPDKNAVPQNNAAPHKDVASAKTPEQRLADGETVILIGKEGLPLLPTTNIPGCDSLLTTQRDGFCTLTTVKTGAVELWSKPLPCPVRFEFEFAVSGNPNLDIEAGIYVGRKVTQAVDGLHQTLIWFSYREEINRTLVPPKLFGVGSVILGWGLPNPTNDKTTLEYKLKERGPLDPDPKLIWQNASVVIEPNQLRFNWNGEQFKTIEAADTGKKLDNLIVRNYYPNGGLAFTPPILGPGIGLLINKSGEMVYRNAKLIPLPR